MVEFGAESIPGAEMQAQRLIEWNDQKDSSDQGKDTGYERILNL